MVRSGASVGQSHHHTPSVPTSDVRRFDESLADDVLCSNPDGSQVGRSAFLNRTARPMLGRLTTLCGRG
jgi:hypothetical protein